MKKVTLIFASTCILLCMAILLTSCNNRFFNENVTTTFLNETTSKTQETELTTTVANTTITTTEKETSAYTTSQITTTFVSTTSEYEGKDFSEFYFEEPYNAWVYSPYGSISIYRYPSKNSDVLKNLSNKKTIEVIGKFSDWHIVKVNETSIGFVKIQSDNVPLMEIREFERTENINSLNLLSIGTATTSSSIENSNRATNLEVSSNAASIIVKNGDTFSMNQATGPRSSSAGYKEAIVFVNGESTNGLGGGVCQTTTTIHMAIKNAISNGYNIQILEANKHSKKVSYASNRNDEAMVNWGSSDFRFVNNTGKDIAIKVTAENQTVTAEISLVIISL